MLRTTLITAPKLAINLDDAKDHLRVTHDEENALISRCIKAAVAYAESYTSTKLMQQTWNYNIDTFPSGNILLPYPPLISVSYIYYYDSTNTQITTLAENTDYWVDTVSKPARIKYINSWPTTYDRLNAVDIRFVCGHATKESIPQNIIDALYLLIGHFYENRQAVMISSGPLTQQVLHTGANDLLNLEKIYNPVLR